MAVISISPRLLQMLTVAANLMRGRLPLTLFYMGKSSTTFSWGGGGKKGPPGFSQQP